MVWSFYSQTYVMGTDTGVQTTCSGTFVDSGNVSGEYSNDDSFEITFCPDTTGNYIQLNFATFIVEGTPFDFLTVYEGTGLLVL